MPAKRLIEITSLAVISIVLFVVIGEVFLRIYLSRKTFYDVEMSRYALTLKVDSPDPLIGHHHRPNAEADLMGVNIRTNADGFRDDEYSIEKGERRRILFLGDSLTLGWGVEKVETFEHALEAALNDETPTEVINLGVGNYNTTQEVHLFIGKGLKYRPDQVVLFYFINDAEPLPKPSRSSMLGHLRLITFYWSRIKALKARMNPSGGFYEYYSELYRPDAEGWERSRAAFVALRDLCREQGIDLAVVILPELHELEEYPFAKEHGLVMSFLAESGIRALDLAPFFRNEDDPHSLWVSMDDAHPNARAHALIAKYTLDFLSEKDEK